MNYVGDFQPGSNVFIWYNTFSSNDPSASVTTTNLTDTDVHIFKDDSLTQRTNAAGVAVDVDIDTYAGVHKITIDTADNTVADFYEAGHDYAVVVEGTTVDAGTVNACVGTFSIANRRVAGQMCSSSIEAYTDTTNFTLTTGEASGNNDAYNGCTIIVTDQVTKIQKGVGYISDYVGATRAIVLHVAPLQTAFTWAVGDSVEIFATSAFVADAVWDEVLTGSSHNISTSAGKRLRQIEEAFVHASGVIATVTNGHTFTLDAGAVATADYYVGDRLQLVEGTGAGQSRLIVAYTSGKAVTLDSDFTTNPDTSTLYEINAADVHVSLSDADQASGFVATYTNTTTITLDAAAVATTDYYLGSLIVFTHGTGAGQVRRITAYTNGRVVTMSPALATALDTTTVWHVQAAISAAEIVNEWESQSQSDPTGFHVNVKEVSGTGQTANDNGADINTLITQVGTAGDGLTAINLPNQTMDIAGTITTVTGDVQGNVDGTVAGVTPAAVGAAMTLAADAVDATSVHSNALDAIVMSDLAAGAPSATAGIVAAINWIYELCRNKVVTDKTNSEIIIYKDDGSTKLCESDISDDGTLFTRGEFGAAD